jgi:chromosome partitioning protein
MRIRAARILVVAGAKGGTGKTTSAVALAFVLAELGFRVVLVDLDPQASATAALHLDVILEPQSPLQFTPVPIAGDLFTDECSIRVARGGRAVDRAGEREVSAFLRTCVADADVLVVDTVPGLQPSVRAALRLCDVLLVPLEAEYLPARGFGEMRAALADSSPTARLRAVFTKHRAGLRLSREIEAALEQACPGALCVSRIPLDVRCAEAPGVGLPVSLSAPKSRAALAYRALAEELVADLGMHASPASRSEGNDAP